MHLFSNNLCKAWDGLHSKDIYLNSWNSFYLFIFLFKIILILSAQLSNLNIFSLERLIITILIQYYINMQDRPRVDQFKAFKMHLNLSVSVEKKGLFSPKRRHISPILNKMLIEVLNTFSRVG